MYSFSDFVFAHPAILTGLALIILAAELIWAVIGRDRANAAKTSEARKEQLKLRATMFNNIAIAMFTIGVLSPLVAALYKLLNAPKHDDVVLYATGWLAAGIAFHFFGVLTLKGIR